MWPSGSLATPAGPSKCTPISNDLWSWNLDCSLEVKDNPASLTVLDRLEIEAGIAKVMAALVMAQKQINSRSCLGLLSGNLQGERLPKDSCNTAHK
jgi:hypothetical protein